MASSPLTAVRQAQRQEPKLRIDGRVLFVDKQVSPTSHGRNVAAKLAELGIPRRRANQFDDDSRVLLEKSPLAALER